MPLNNQELALLIGILHFKEKFTLKDIATVLKIPYWKVKDFASVFENNRFLKIKHYNQNLIQYKENLASYERDQKQLKSLFWKVLVWVKLWIPSSKPSLPSLPVLEPDKSPDFQDCYDRCVKRLNRNRKAKYKSKPKIT